MKKKYISIKTIPELSEFLSHSNNVEGDVIIHRGKFIIDAKSIMGIMSIDISEKCMIEYPEDAIEFEQYITKFEV